MSRSLFLATLLVATTSALVVPSHNLPSIRHANGGSLRKSESPRAPLRIKGGGLLPAISTYDALTTSAVMIIIFAVVCLPGNPMPAIDITGVKHSNTLSMFEGRPVVMTDALTHLMKWICFAYACIGTYTLIVAKHGSEDLKKLMAKTHSITWALSLGILYMNKQPWQCGAYFTNALVAAVCGIAGFS